jgi:short-subunit dehydrogenase
MVVIRGRSTPVGRAMAEQLKREGKTLNELVARKDSRAILERLPRRRNAVRPRKSPVGALECA